MHVAVMGSGAVGGYFGAKLARSGVHVTLIARGEHLRTIRRQGLAVLSVDGDFVVHPPCTDDPSEVGPCDLVLFTVKSHATVQAANLIRPLLGEATAVLCLQNGVNNEDKIAEAIGDQHVLPGVAYVGTEVVAPGRLKHEARGDIVFGERDGVASERATRIERLFIDAGVPCEAVSDIVARKWQKFLFNCALNPMTAITGRRLPALVHEPETRSVFQEVVREAEAVARRERIDLPADVVAQVMATADRMDIRSSMQADLEQQRPIELDTFNGHVVALGRKHGVPTPMNAMLVGLLRARVGAPALASDRSTLLESAG